MLGKKKIFIASVISVLVVGIAFILLKPEQRIDEEVQEHFDVLYSLSGKLTPDQKQDYFDSSLALSKIQQPLPQKELDKINEHVRTLIIENPDLMLSAREFDEKYGHIAGYTHGHPPADELEQETQKALDQVDVLITELEASDLPENVKEGFLHIFNYKREGLMKDPNEQSVEMKNKYIEFWKTDPTITGISENLFTGEYVPLYPNMITVYRQRTHQADGTVDDVVKNVMHSATPENASVVEAYLRALDRMPPGEPTPSPPEFEDMHFSVEYKDVYPKSDEDIINSMKEPLTIGDKVFLLHDTLEDIDDPKMQRIISHFLQEIIGIPFEQFLNMSDAEIESQIIHSLRHRLPEISDTTSPVSILEKNLLGSFSSFRVNRAMAAVKQLGPKNGLRHLKEVDPEVAMKLEFLLTGQENR